MRQRSKSCFMASAPLEYDDENLAANSDTESGKSWTDEDTTEFLEIIRNYIPDNDKLSFQTRKEKINWDNIAFKNHSAADCKWHFEELAKRIRRFRTFDEILTDIEKSVSNVTVSNQLVTPWSLYYDDIKGELKNDNINKNKSELLNIAHEKYKSLEPKEKSHYKKQAKNLNKKFDNSVLTNKILKSKSKTSGKSSKTGYHIFLKDMHDELKDLPSKQKMSIVSEKWKAMDADLKKKFNKRAKVINEESNKSISNNTVAEKKPINKKRKTTKSGYNIFITETICSDEMKKLPPNQRIIELSRLWRELDDDLKNNYLKRAKMLKEQSLDETILSNTECESPKKDKKSGKKSKTKVKKNDETDNNVTNIDINKSLSKKRKHYSDEETTYENNVDYDNYDNGEFENNDNVDYGDNDGYEDDTYGVDSLNYFNDEKTPKKETSAKKQKKAKSIVTQPATPPSSVFEYFKSEVHSGNPLKAEAAYEKLSDVKKSEIVNDYKELSKNYLIKLKDYLQTLTKKEITEFYKLRKSKQ